MKVLSTIAVAALVSGGVASSASAMQRTFEPANTAFTATGSIALTSSSGTLACRTTLTGATVNGAGSISGATFSGGGSCASLTATGLPWKMLSYGNSGTGVNFTTVGFSGTSVGVCGPSRVKGTLGVGGKITISGAGLSGTPPCSLSGTLTTSPAIRIAPK